MRFVEVMDGWATFNIPLDTVEVISETMFLQVRRPSQQCQSTEGGWLVIQIALNLARLIVEVKILVEVHSGQLTSHHSTKKHSNCKLL